MAFLRNDVIDPVLVIAHRLAALVSSRKVFDFIASCVDTSAYLSTRLSRLFKASNQLFGLKARGGVGLS